MLNIKDILPSTISTIIKIISFNKKKTIRSSKLICGGERRSNE